MLTYVIELEQVAAATGELRAGGTDLQERRRSGIASGPIVDISRLPDLAAIGWGADGAATIGALAKVAALANDAALAAAYPGLAQAAGGLATPQIRAMASLGGCLLQRTRCAYYRHPGFSCYKKGGDSCPARAGHHSHGVIFERGPCIYPHPSTLGLALLAYEAQVEVAGRGRLSIEALYGDGSDPSRDHTLGAGELLAKVIMPPPLAGERAAYGRAISRAEAEWPLVECIVRLGLSGGQISFARVAVGGVATVPLRLPLVEAALIGGPPDAATFARAAARAAEGARPLAQTGYKAELLQRTVLEMLERTI
jgi:xanthine dehydrogenase YagS FAD-binding subunit